MAMFLKSIHFFKGEYIRGYSSVVEHSIAARTVPGSNPGAPFFDTMAEWLRRCTANPMGSARAGSNPAGVDYCSGGIMVITPRCGRGDTGSIPV